MKDGQTNRNENLRIRTKKYASAVGRLFCCLPGRRAEVDVLEKQMLRSGTSVAANHREASRARSNAQFTSKIETCLQEAHENMLWLELLRDDCAITDDSLVWLHGETNELISIFVTMVKKVKEREE